MKSLLTALLLSAAFFTIACNTIEGIGQDVKGAGEWTAESAQKVKQKID